MKGMVFTEFLDFIEDKFGLEVVDQLVNESSLESGGAYTRAGYYPHTELLAMLGVLSKATNLPIPALVKTFGQHLFGRLIQLRPELLAGINNLYTFLDSVESVIHVDVHRVYPDAELPSISTWRQENGDYIFKYVSRRGFADLAEGMLNGAIAHFNAKVNLERINLPDIDGVQAAEFRITPK